MKFRTRRNAQVNMFFNANINWFFKAGRTIASSLGIVLLAGVSSPLIAQPQPVLVAQGRIAQSSTAKLTGTVTYRQRIALPPSAVVEVKLQEVSRLDAPAVTVAEQTIQTNGRQVPIPFELGYDASQIDSRYTYVVQVRILVDNQLQWINTSAYRVLTQGNPANNIEVIVNQARASELPSPSPLPSPQSSSRYNCDAQVRSYKSVSSVNLEEAQRLRLQRDGNRFIYRCTAAAVPDDRYDCKSQVSTSPDRRAVNLVEAEELLQQMNGNTFVYQCSLSR